MYAASAIAQLALGAPLLAETWLVALAFGLAAALTLVAAYRVSGSVAVGLVAAVVEVALFPRSYHYPKLLVHAAGVLSLFAYGEMPTRRRAAVVAGCIVIGMLFRHDHGVYLAIGAVMTAVLARPGWRTMVRHVSEAVGFSLAFASPYLVYLQASTGLVAHVRSGLAYSDAEAERTALGFPTIDIGLLLTDDGLRVCFFYALHALPLRAPWSRFAGRPPRRRVPAGLNSRTSFPSPCWGWHSTCRCCETRFRRAFRTSRCRPVFWPPGSFPWRGEPGVAAWRREWPWRWASRPV